MKVCPHDIERNQPCSLCATSARLISAYDDGEIRQVLQLVGGEQLPSSGPVPTGDDAGRSDAGDAIEAGIWLVTLYDKHGKPGIYPVLTSDIRAQEMFYAGFEMSEVTDLQDALMAAESQGGSIQ